MNRRVFLKTSAIGGTAMAWGFRAPTKVTHTLTLSFDDGFRRSFFKVADIFEANGLSACFNVIASGHLPDFQRVDDWILPEILGDFDDWNTLASRGHEVMPHSWKHLNLARQPLDEAKVLINKCLDYFSENLEGYKNEDAVFNFPFNSSSPELEAYVLEKVLALRSRELPEDQSYEGGIFRQGCFTNGPKNIDKWVDRRINEFLATPRGWLILNVHGLDEEGWGPMSSAYLGKLITRLTKISTLEILPTGAVLKRHRDQ